MNEEDLVLPAFFNMTVPTRLTVEEKVFPDLP